MFLEKNMPKCEKFLFEKDSIYIKNWMGLYQI